MATKIVFQRRDGSFLQKIDYTKHADGIMFGTAFQFDDAQALVFDKCANDGSPDPFTVKVALEMDRHGIHATMVPLGAARCRSVPLVPTTEIN